MAPLLFLIYVNDLSERVSSYISMFADDAKMTRNVKIEEDCRSYRKTLGKLQECDAGKHKNII